MAGQSRFAKAEREHKDAYAAYLLGVLEVEAAVEQERARALAKADDRTAKVCHSFPTHVQSLVI